jgi:hypothetical protein
MDAIASATGGPQVPAEGLQQVKGHMLCHAQLNMQIACTRLEGECAGWAGGVSLASEHTLLKHLLALEGHQPTGETTPSMLEHQHLRLCNKRGGVLWSRDGTQTASWVAPAVVWPDASAVAACCAGEEVTLVTVDSTGQGVRARLQWQTADAEGHTSSSSAAAAAVTGSGAGGTSSCSSSPQQHLQVVAVEPLAPVDPNR